MDRYAEKLPLEIVSNTPDIQAVRHRELGISEIAFYQPGRISAASMSIASNKPCLLLIREMGEKVRLAASNPENQPLELSVELGKKLEGEGCDWDEQKGVTRILLKLPEGDLAGSSVVCDLLDREK
jgi:chondroitin AC lyase